MSRNTPNSQTKQIELRSTARKLHIETDMEDAATTARRVSNQGLPTRSARDIIPSISAGSPSQITKRRRCIGGAITVNANCSRRISFQDNLSNFATARERGKAVIMIIRGADITETARIRKFSRRATIPDGDARHNHATTVRFRHNRIRVLVARY